MRVAFILTVKINTSLPPTRNRCVFSCKMRMAFILIVNWYVIPADRGEIVVFSHVKCAWPASCLNTWIATRDPLPRTRVFLNKKARCTNPPGSLCFSGKMRFCVQCDKFIWHATSRSRTPYLFSTKTCVAETLPVSIRFFNESASCVQGECKFTCTFLVYFQRKCASQESCCIPWVHFPCVFSSNPRLALRSDCEFTCDEANCSLTPNIFQGKRASREGFFGVVTAIASFHSYPSQEESQILTKEHCTGDVGLFDSQFLTNRGSLMCEREISKRMSHHKVGMSKVAYHRLLVEGLDVVKRAKRWNTIGPSQKRQLFKGAKEMMKLSFTCAQRSVAAWKRKHYVSFCVQRVRGTSQVVNQARVYVCSGRAGGNERRLLFYARYEETWHPQPQPNPKPPHCVASTWWWKTP